MPSFTYHILNIPSREQYAQIFDEPSDLEASWLLEEGEPMGKNFPVGASCSMRKEHKGTKLDDFIYNPYKWLLVSQRAWNVFEKEPVRFEQLPFKILDKKGHPVKQTYWLAHLLGVADCVDLNASTFERSSFEPERVHTFEKLVLDEKRIPPEDTLFRIKEQPNAMIIRSDLVQRLEHAGITGFELWPLNAPILL